MANEITALEGTGDNDYRILLLYPIATPKQVMGSNVIPTPSANLPSLGQQILTASEKAALDEGTLAFEVISFHKQPGMTNTQLAARAREIYAAKLTAFQSDYTKRYEFSGVRINQ